MKRFSISILILSLIFGCNKPDHPNNGETDKVYEPIVLTKAENDIAIGMNSFGFDIFHQQIDIQKDLLLSPLSASIALSMAAEGAKDETKDQIL